MGQIEERPYLWRDEPLGELIVPLGGEGQMKLLDRLVAQPYLIAGLGCGQRLHRVGDAEVGVDVCILVAV